MEMILRVSERKIVSFESGMTQVSSSEIRETA